LKFILFAKFDHFLDVGTRTSAKAEIYHYFLKILRW